MNGLDIDSVVSFKHPKKKSKTFVGKVLAINEAKNEVEVEIFNAGAGKKGEQLVKIVIPEKNIKAVLDTDNQVKPIDGLENAERHSDEALIDPKSMFHEIFNYFNVNIHDCPCLLVPVKNKTGETILKFEWNKEQYNEFWNDNTVIPLEAMATESGDTVNITFTKPFQQNFVINKSNIIADAVNTRDMVFTAFDRIKDAVTAKYMQFKFKHDCLIDDANDYVDAVLNRVYDGMCESVQQQQGEIEIPQYELTEDLRVVSGYELYRIKAVNAIPKFGVRAGQIGGYVQSLSNVDGGWVADDACVYENAIVRGVVRGKAMVSDSVIIEYDSVVKNTAVVTGKGRFYGTVISGKAHVSGDIKTLENSIIKSRKANSNIFISDNVKVAGPMVLSGNVKFKNFSNVSGMGKGLVIDGATFLDNTIINATGTIQGEPTFRRRNMIIGEVKIDTRQAPGSSFSNITSSGSFKIKGAQVVQMDSKPIESEQPEQSEQIEQPEEQEELNQSVSYQVGEHSIANNPAFAKKAVSNPKQWMGPTIKKSELSEEEIAYLNSLEFPSFDADSSPAHYETELEELEARDMVVDVAGIYTFYLVFKDDGHIDKMWKLEKGIVE